MIFKLKFKLSRGRSASISGPLLFVSTANGTSIEKSNDNNVCTVKARVIKRAELDIVGISDPALVYFGGEVRGESAMEYEEDVGPQVQLTYLVRNNGPWGVGNVTVLIDFPFEVNSPFAHGKWALYLMSTPAIEIPIPGSTEMERRNCYIDYLNERVDPLNLRVGYSPVHQPEERFKRQAGGRETSESSSNKQSSSFEPYQGRQARALRIRPEEVQFSGETYSRVVISCNKNLKERTAKCFVIRCLIDYLESNMTASIRIRSRLWNSTFVEDYRDVDHVLIKSRATVEIDKKQGIEESNYTDNEAEVNYLNYFEIC
ncbi:unnamed protein product [Soboliphyme baturini]|uniref:Integrin alpha third immunoglobulin-like domain-containing protein n=1 Tax=Soboliphyme baturini TaxID=241478 RepID=A0A3P8B850_9BILA|nr:unnamed protein product [Soboliphyme baturini]